MTFMFEQFFSGTNTYIKADDLEQAIKIFESYPESKDSLGKIHIYVLIV